MVKKRQIVAWSTQNRTKRILTAPLLTLALVLQINFTDAAIPPTASDLESLLLG
jgi:hypothetical protein